MSCHKFTSADPRQWKHKHWWNAGTCSKKTIEHQQRQRRFGANSNVNELRRLFGGVILMNYFMQTLIAGWRAIGRFPGIQLGGGIWRWGERCVRAFNGRWRLDFKIVANISGKFVTFHIFRHLLLKALLYIVDYCWLFYGNSGLFCNGHPLHYLTSLIAWKREVEEMSSWDVERELMQASTISMRLFMVFSAFSCFPSSAFVQENVICVYGMAEPRWWKYRANFSTRNWNIRARSESLSFLWRIFVGEKLRIPSVDDLIIEGSLAKYSRFQCQAGLPCRIHN